MTDQEQRLTVARTLNVPADELYAAWTDPDVMRRWMGSRIEADVRVGGEYRREIESEDGARYVHRGLYRVLEPNRRIVQSFEVEGVEARPFADEEVEVTFNPVSESQTELTLVDRWNGPPLSPNEERAARAAWSEWIGRVERLFE